MTELLDVLIVGGGPTGLACGIEAARASLKLLIVEKGCLVNSLYSYPANMTFFTTRERLEIGDIPFASINVKPTRAEALEYYRRVADFYHLPVHYQERVMAIRQTGARQEPTSSGNNPAPSLAAGADGSFEVEAEAADGKRRSYLARKVIIATGYYDLPNALGIPGEDLPKVSHYAIEGHAFFQRKVAVIGGANSAAVTSLDLYRHGAETTIIYRRPELSRHIKYWIRPDLENRIKEGSIKAYFESEVKEIADDWICVQNAKGETIRLQNDFVLALTGYHPDVDLLRSTGVEVDPKSYRPACNSKTLESNVPGLYLAGVVVSGRHTNEIFIENGRFHGKQIVADIKKKLADRHEA
ncbi:MAG: YpdA family putative bacillithiol disulfide reductase [Acidobacteria bacterium]|nr:MAG: YpdA family putative bacillithiol disulfide reductase [Acidobacteriota bacterium]